MPEKKTVRSRAGAVIADKMKLKRIKWRKNSSKSMSIWGHLKELRTCLVVIAVTYAAATIVCYCFAPEFITYAISLAKGYTFVQTGVAELLAQYILVSLIAGAVLDSPVIVWQVMKFVGPGLKLSEEIKLLAVLLSGLLLFAAGTLFAACVMVPFTLQFFLSLNTIGIRGMYSIREYISYMVSLLFAFGLIFEIPIASAVLASLGLLRPQWMRNSRRIVLVLCFVIGAVLTPPDVASQIIMAVPMYLLFEASTVICAVVYNRRCKRLTAQGLDPDETCQKKERKPGMGRWAAAKAAEEKEEKKKCSK